MVRVILPYHLATLAQSAREVRFELGSPVTIGAILLAIEEKYPMLAGTIREHGTGQRRPLLRFFACEEDWSNEPAEKELPEAVSTGLEAFYIIGAIAGG